MYPTASHKYSQITANIFVSISYRLNFHYTSTRYITIIVKTKTSEPHIFAAFHLSCTTALTNRGLLMSDNLLSMNCFNFVSYTALNGRLFWFFPGWSLVILFVRTSLAQMYLSIAVVTFWFYLWLIEIWILTESSNLQSVTRTHRFAQLVEYGTGNSIPWYRVPTLRPIGFFD